MITKRLRESQWTTFVIMVVLLTLKSCIWHIQLFGDWDILVDTHIFTATWLSVWVLACRHRPWWTLGIFLLANAWMFSCYVYYKVWGVFVTMDEVRILDNLKGFESSIFADWRWSMLLWLALPDAIYAGWLGYSKPAERRLWREMLIVIACGVLMVPLRQCRYHHRMLPQLKGYNNQEGFAHFWYEAEPLFNLYYQPAEEARLSFNEQIATGWEHDYIHDNGIMDYGIAMIVFDHYYKYYEAEVMNDPVTLTEEQDEMMRMLCHTDSCFQPERSLVVIMVESFETWAIDAKGSDGSWVMPNLRRFMEENNIFYAPEIKNMILRGGSSDGQLMLMTGLAPVSKGVTVALYGDQPYPNFAHYFDRSRTLNPVPGVWKQPIVNPRYGVKELEESDSIHDDAGLFHRLNCINLDTISFTFVITVSSHVPFDMADNVDYAIDGDMPEKAIRYLKCMHYLDEQLGTFLSRIKSDASVRNADIVITADHSIMFPPDFDELKAYAVRKGLSTAHMEFGISPMIVYSPVFTNKRVYEERGCQVDIYPTILGVMGCEQPEWEGVGINLLQEEERRIDVEEAYMLSDKLIRGKWFN